MTAWKERLTTSSCDMCVSTCVHVSVMFFMSQPRVLGAHSCTVDSRTLPAPPPPASPPEAMRLWIMDKNTIQQSNLVSNSHFAITFFQDIAMPTSLETFFLYTTQNSTRQLLYCDLQDQGCNTSVSRLCHSRTQTLPQKNLSIVLKNNFLNQYQF